MRKKNELFTAAYLLESYEDEDLGFADWKSGRLTLEQLTEQIHNQITADGADTKRSDLKSYLFERFMTSRARE